MVQAVGFEATSLLCIFSSRSFLQATALRYVNGAGLVGIAHRRSAIEASRLDCARHRFKRPWTAVAFF